MAGRMVDKMQSNAAFMVNHVKRTYRQLAREITGSDGGGPGDREH